MSGLYKRITQTTFDEVVEENIEEFDMSKAEAVQDAIEQFQKQGIDLSNIDTTTGEGRKELLEIFENVSSTPVPAPDSASLLAKINQITNATKKNHILYKRNMILIYHQGGLNAVHAHFDVREEPTLLLAVINLLTQLSQSSVEIRDFFEPGGSNKANQILTHYFSLLQQAGESNPINLQIADAVVNLCRIVGKSERNKTALMKSGIGSQLIQIIEFYAPSFSTSSSSSTVSPVIVHFLEKVCLLIREISIHNDNRSEMSSAFENGKQFIKNSAFVINLISLIKEYEHYPTLASNGLLALKALITTNEAVQIISLHGILDLLSKILSAYTKIVIDLVNATPNPPPSSSSSSTTAPPAPVNVPASENEEEENEIEAENNEQSSSTSGKSTTPAALSSSTAVGHNENNLLLLRGVIALIRNIIADDQKKEHLVSQGALQSLLFLFLYSQQVSILSTQWNILNDYYLIEHLFGCFAQFTLRSPKNSLILMNNSQSPKTYQQFLPLLIFYLTKYSTQDSLHRQSCLMLHNIINRCPEYKSIFLDYHIHEVTQSISAQLNTVKDESYTLLRDLGINIQYMKLDEATGKLVPVYEMFGNLDAIAPGASGGTSKKLNFNPVFDESSNIQDRIVEEAHAPFAKEEEEGEREGHVEEHHHSHGHDHDHHHHGDGCSDDEHEGGCCAGEGHDHDHDHHQKKGDGQDEHGHDHDHHSSSCGCDGEKASSHEHQQSHDHSH